MLHCNRKPQATAMVKGSEEYPGLRGRVLFFQEMDSVLVKAEIVGLPENETGFFGFHIHEGKNCGGDAVKILSPTVTVRKNLYSK